MSRQVGRADRAAALGTEQVGRLLVHTSVQTTMAVATYGIYALTNAWFVARGVGPVALAAVNVVAPVLLLLGALSTTVGTGGASVISRALGAGDPRRAAVAAGTCLSGFWLGSLVLGLTGVLLLDPLLRLLGASGDVLRPAHDYGMIILAGSVFGTGFSSLMRAEGRMGFSTLTWVIPVLTQIALDPLFIFGLGWGVRGAALGTVGGQLVSSAMGTWFFLGQRRRPYRIGVRDLVPRRAMLAEIGRVGSPSFLAGFGRTLLTAVINNLLAGVGGVVALGAFAIASRVGTFVLMPQLGLAQALQPIVGFNVGAGRDERAHRALRLSLWASLGYGLVTLALVAPAAQGVAGLFTGDAAVAGEAAVALRLIALSYPVAGLVGLVAAAFQSIGRGLPSLWLSVGTLAAIKLPAVLVLATLGLLGLWVSFPAGELLSALVAVAALRRIAASPPH
ncbi:MAG TPA: MATE family efflux transporter [Propionibacteriaceae bacterium]|nr:MATE family efflux transporter [Propionibacteriaceae bacterium]